jgi:hypothetical protein
MATSTNYGWSEPDNTSLVKDGALAIRTLGNAIDTSLWNSGYGQAGKNALINGAFDIWQRGTSFTNPGTSLAYNADRWFSYFNGTGTITQETTIKPDTSTYSLKNTATGTSADNAIYQLVEQFVMERFRGKTVTLSVKFAGTATVAPSLRLAYSTTANDTGLNTNINITATNVIAPTINTSTFVTYSATFAVPTTAKTLRIGILSNAVVNTNVLYIAETQLEYGSLATPFQTASGGSIQSELAMCQRYYEKSYDITVAPGTADQLGSIGFCVGTNSSGSTYFTYAPIFKVNKRTQPTITLYDLVGNSGKVTKVSAVDLSMTDNQTATADRLGQTTFRIYSPLATAGGFYGHYVASAEL